MPWDSQTIIAQLVYKLCFFLWNRKLIDKFKNLTMGLPILKLYLFLIYEPLSQVIALTRECHQNKYCVLSVCFSEDLQAYTCHIRAHS